MWEFHDFVDGENGCIYGIPSNANRVLQCNVKEKSVKEIGPYLGKEINKYKYGIKANNGVIYCMPYRAKYILKITTREGQDAEVSILKKKQLPGDNKNKWIEGALSKDGCIYYLPYHSTGHILKLDPNNGDSLSLVGEEIGKYSDTLVLGKEGYIYCIASHWIIKFNPEDHSIFSRRWKHLLLKSARTSLKNGFVNTH